MKIIIAIIIIAALAAAGFYYHVVTETRAEQQAAKAKANAEQTAATGSTQEQTDTPVKTTEVTAQPSQSRLAATLKSAKSKEIAPAGPNKATGPLRNTRPVQRVINTYNTHNAALEQEGSQK